MSKCGSRSVWKSLTCDEDRRRTDCSLAGSLTELMGDLDGAMNSYEQALRHNQWSIQAMNAISCILRTKEQFPKAIEYLENILKLDPTNGETWGSLGHCHLMMDNLQEAYTSYQQALYHLRDPKVSSFDLCDASPMAHYRCRNRNFGTGSVYCTIAMGRSTMRRRHSPKSCAWRPSSKRPTKFISVSASYTSSSKSSPRVWMYVNDCHCCVWR